VSHIHFIGGEKGGVGKSVVARVLTQRLLDLNLPFAAVDADSSHGTLARSYAQYTQRVDLNDCGSADEIMNRAMADERRVIVDLPAQSLRQLQNWFDGADVIRFARELNLNMTLWHVTDGGFDSVADLQRMLDLLGAQLSYIVVKNHGRARDFSQFEESPSKRSLLLLDGKILELPELDSATMYKIDRFGSSFWAAVNNSDGEWVLTSMERQRVRVWLERCYQQLDILGEAI
jgi:hypothetical protein